MTYADKIDAMYEAEQPLWHCQTTWNNRANAEDKRNKQRLEAYHKRVFAHDFAPGI